ncbi:MAG: DUF1007 family protein [Thiolinea sp.]
MISLATAPLRQLTRYAACAALISLATPLAADGYHYEVQAATQFLANPAGELSALKMEWNYDPELAAILLEDEDLSPANQAATLKQRASDILEDLFKLGYFSKLTVDGQPVAINKVQIYQMVFGSDQGLMLSFEIPLKAATSVAGKKISLSLADPDGIGTLAYKTPQQVSLDENLAKFCSTPSVSQAAIELPNDHKPMIPTVTIECK